MKKLILFIAILFLHQLCYSQNLIQFKDGRTIWANSTLTTDSYIEVSFSSDSRHQYLLKDIVLIEYLENGLVYYDSTYLKIINPKSITKPIYQQGNNVYIPFSSTYVAQRCGSIRLRELIEKSGYWNVVNSPLEAHFILKYIFDDTGKDHAYFVIESRDKENVYISRNVNASDWIPQHAGQESAEKLYYIIKKLFFN